MSYNYRGGGGRGAGRGGGPRPPLYDDMRGPPKGGYLGRGGGPPMMHRDQLDRSISPADDYRHPPLEQLPVYANPAPPKGDGPKVPNDVEILVLGEGLTDYAECIERQVRDLGLKVDLMIPRADVRIPTFIESIALEGTKFAIIVRHENQSHRSVTVHVLKGSAKPEEHRNMPLVTAYAFIKERFYSSRAKEIIAPSAVLVAPTAGISSTGGIPEKIKSILRFLLEDRQLSELEYKLVLDFIRDKRRKQLMSDGRNEDFEEETIKDLQGKILAVINGSNDIKKQKIENPLLMPTSPMDQQYEQQMSFNNQQQQGGRVASIAPQQQQSYFSGMGGR